MKIITGLRLVATILLAALILLVPAWIALPFRQRTRTRIMTYPFQFFSYLLRWVFGVRLTAVGHQQTRGSLTRNHLFISNHLSLADTPLLLSLSPYPFIGKKEVLRVPIIAFAGNVGGNLLFDRADPEDRKRVQCDTIRRIREVSSIYLFPEGTRSKSGEPKPEPHWGLIWTAWQENIAVVPVAIFSSEKIFEQFTTRVWIKYGQPLLPTDFLTKEHFATACWQRVRMMFNELKAAAENLVPGKVTQPASGSSSAR
ncbi:MAG: lysophospholipid acyltransferase family protein [Acidobacteriota bacterium]